MHSVSSESVVEWHRLTFEGCVVNMSLYLSKNDLDRIFVLAPSSFSILHCSPWIVPLNVNKGWCDMSWLFWKDVFMHALHFFEFDEFSFEGISGFSRPLFHLLNQPDILPALSQFCSTGRDRFPDVELPNYSLSPYPGRCHLGNFDCGRWNIFRFRNPSTSALEILAHKASTWCCFCPLVLGQFFHNSYSFHQNFCNKTFWKLQCWVHQT